MSRFLSRYLVRNVRYIVICVFCDCEAHILTDVGPVCGSISCGQDSDRDILSEIMSWEDLEMRELSLCEAA